MESNCDPHLLKGIEEYIQELFFECHETLEEIWREDHGEDREFYQGIIQIVAGYFKWDQEVSAGTIKLLRSGLEKVDPYSPTHLDIDVKSFIQGVRENLREVEVIHGTDRAALKLRAPALSFVEERDG
ncbi:MAG: DUF309 domain-containing protein [Candidatus Binatia bacterium]|jgi:hypothetical protein|nr:DUF309 domain-containing protein [Candidatus Binatia bacterium]